MLRRVPSLVAGTCFLALAVAADVGGAPITNGFGLAAPAVTVTFDELVFAADTEIVSQYAAFGLTFSSLRYDGGSGSLPGVAAPFLRNYYNDPSGNILGQVNPFSIFFAVPQTAAAFGLATNSATTTFTARLSGAEVEVFSATTSYTDPSRAFYGFSGVLFDEIHVDVSDGFGGLALIDNVQLGAVPEPGTLLLVGGGLLALTARRRRGR